MISQRLFSILTSCFGQPGWVASETERPAGCRWRWDPHPPGHHLVYLGISRPTTSWAPTTGRRLALLQSAHHHLGHIGISAEALKPQTRASLLARSNRVCTGHDVVVVHEARAERHASLVVYMEAHGWQLDDAWWTVGDKHS